MFIPIVRRSVTVRMRQVFDHPFQCDACQLQTVAHVLSEGVGSASMAYLSPDANVARRRAWDNAQRTAWDTLSRTPCPRCGTHGAAQRAAVYAWQQKAASRAQTRTRVVQVGIALTLLWGASCGAVVALPSNGHGSDLGAAIVSAVGCLVIGAIGFGILWAVLGPGPAPVLLQYIPQNVRFDPPPPAPYRGG